MSEGDAAEWLRLEAGGRVRLYPLPPIPTTGAAAARKAMEARARIVVRLRDRYGIPADWAEHPDRGVPMRRTAAGHMLPATGHGWDVAIIGGPVHESLRAIATVHNDTDLGEPPA